MSYGHTNFYNIPYPLEGSFISEDQERRKAQIIENQLLAANRFADCVVIHEGEYEIIEEDGVFLRLSSYGRNPSIMGIVNGGLCLTYSTLEWEKATPGYKYYCYIDWTSEMFEEHEHFNLSMSKEPKNSRKSLLVATLDITSRKPSLDIRPEGKLYADSFSSHLWQTVNPHGHRMKVENLITDKVSSDNELVLSDNRTTLKLSDDEHQKFNYSSLMGAIAGLAQEINELRQENAQLASRLAIIENGI